MKPKFKERRRYGRLVGDFEVDIVLLDGQKAGDQISGRVINISREGIGIATSTDLQVGSQLSLTIYVNDYESACTGHVIWTKELDGQRIYGIKIPRWSHLESALERELPRS